MHYQWPARAAAVMGSPELTVGSQPSADAGSAKLNASSWPGRAEASLKLVAGNRSSERIWRGKFCADPERQVMADNAVSASPP